MSSEQPTSEGSLAGSVPALLCHTALPKMWNSVDVGYFHLLCQLQLQLLGDLKL